VWEWKERGAVKLDWRRRDWLVVPLSFVIARLGSLTSIMQRRWRRIKTVVVNEMKFAIGVCCLGGVGSKWSGTASSLSFLK